MPIEFSYYQLLTPTFSVIMIFQAFSRFRRAEQTLKELFVWFFVWSVMAGVSVFPDFFVSFAEFAGFKNGVFGIVFFCIIVMFFIIFKLLLFLERLERKLSDVVRHQALFELDLKNSLEKLSSFEGNKEGNSGDPQKSPSRL